MSYCATFSGTFATSTERACSSGRAARWGGWLIGSSLLARTSETRPWRTGSIFPRRAVPTVAENTEITERKQAPRWDVELLICSIYDLASVDKLQLVFCSKNDASTSLFDSVGVAIPISTRPARPLIVTLYRTQTDDIRTNRNIDWCGMCLEGWHLTLFQGSCIRHQ